MHINGNGTPNWTFSEIIMAHDSWVNLKSEGNRANEDPQYQKL